MPVMGGWLCHARYFEKVTGCADFWADPRGIAIEGYRRSGVDMIVQLALPKHPKDTTEGAFGRQTNFSKQGEVAFRSPEDAVKWIEALPTLRDLRDEFNLSQVYDQWVEVMESGQRDCGDMLWLPGHVAGLCRFMWYSTFGYENYLILAADYKEQLRRLFEWSGEDGRLRNVAVAKAIRERGHVPVVYVGEDICGNNGPMMSPKLLEEVYFPYVRRSLEPLKEAGIKIVWHSDGDIRPIILALLECGVDGFQGVQEEVGVDFGELGRMRSRSGEPLILWGSVSVTTTLPHGTPEDVWRAVKRCVDIAVRRPGLPPGAGFVLSPTSSVGPEVPIENIEAFFDAARELGRLS